MRFLPSVSVLLGCVCAAAGAEVAPLKLAQTIPLPGIEGRFDHFAIDEKGRRLFVAALGNNTLEVIDLGAGKRVRSVPGLRKPQGVLFLGARELLCVASGGDGVCKIFEASDFKPAKR